MFIVRAAAVHRLLLNSRGKLKAHHYPPCPRRAASRFESSISVNSIYPGTGKDAIAKGRIKEKDQVLHREERRKVNVFVLFSDDRCHKWTVLLNGNYIWSREINEYSFFITQNCE